MRLRVLYPCVVTLVAIALSACGGGGGSTTVASAPESYKVLQDKSGISLPSSKGRSVYKPQHTTSGLDSSDSNTHGFSGKGKKIAVFEMGLYLNDVKEFQDSDGNSRMGKGRAINEGTPEDFDGYKIADAPSGYYCKIDYELPNPPKFPKKVNKDDGKCGAGYIKTSHDGNHTLSVASAMAGSESGIANRATILPYQVGNFEGSIAYGKASDLHDDIAYKYAYEDAKKKGVLAINNSYGESGSDSSYVECFNDNSVDICDKRVIKKGKLGNALSLAFLEIFTYDKHPSKPDKNSPIMVYATGNSGLEQATIQARAGYHESKIKNWIIAVASINEHGKESSFSNRCGVAKDYCMTALGENVNVLDRDKQANTLVKADKKGTSFSTPLVTGAFALLGEKFPDISVQEIRKRLLTTARHTLKLNGVTTPLRTRADKTPTLKKSDACFNKVEGCSDEFGNGALRLDLAMAPVGQSKSAYNSKNLLSAQRQPIKNTKLEASGAFGSGIKQAFNDKVTTVYDALDAPFQHRMSSFVSGGQHNNTYSALALASQDRPVHTTKIVNTSGLAYTTDRHDTATQMGFVASSNGVNSILGKHLNYRANVGTMNFITAVEPNDGTLMYSVERSFRYNKTTITPLTKIIYEQNKVLGAKGSATLATTGASTSTFIGMKAQTHIKGIDIYTYAHYGITRTRGDFGVSLQNLNNIESNDFGLSFSKGFETPRSNGKFGVAYSMPLRVTRADATLHYNSGRDKDKNLFYKTEQVDIAPTGKARMIEAFYQTDSKNKPHSLRLHIIHNRDIDHTRGVNATSIGAYYKIKFNSDTIFKNVHNVHYTP